MSAIRRSAIWNVFTETHKSDFIATCNICSQEFSYRSTTTNLMKHLQRKHPNISVDLNSSHSKPKEGPSQTPVEFVIDRQLPLEDDTKETPFKLEEQPLADDSEFIKLNNGKTISFIWEFFTKLPNSDYLASCNNCQKEFSYKTTTTNLKKHLERKHPEHFAVSGETHSTFVVYNSADEVSDSDQNSSVSVPQIRKNESILWTHFTKIPNSDCLAFCNICKKELSYKSTNTNLRRHLERVHSEDLSASEELILSNHVSLTWNYFTKITNSDALAFCNICNQQFSYKISVSNLTEHLELQHPSIMPADEENNSNCIEFSSIEDLPHSDRNRKYVSPMWEYFTKVQYSDMVATCNICNQELSCKSVSNLKKHLERKHPDSIIGSPEIFDNFVDCSVTQKNNFEYEEPSHRKTISELWEYFTQISESDSQAYCNLCHQEFSYKSNTSNLKEHLSSKHSNLLPAYKLNDNQYLDLNMSDVFNIQGTSANETSDPFHEQTLNTGQTYFATSAQGSKNVTTAENVDIARLSHHNLQFPLNNAPAQTFDSIGSNAEITEMESQQKITDNPPISEVKSNVEKPDIDINIHSDLKLATEDHTYSLWDYFTKNPLSNYLAECKFCYKTFSYASTTDDLQNHVNRNHLQQSTQQLDISLSEINTENNVRVIKSRSSVWKYFTQNSSQETLTCNVCQGTFSYRSGQGSTGNLWKHITRKHPELSVDRVDTSADDNSDEEHQQNNETDCGNLEKDAVVKNSNKYESNTNPDKGNVENKRRFLVWKYFTQLPDSDTPCCNVCNEHIQCKSGTSNLWRHIAEKHPEIQTNRDEIASNDENPDNNDSFVDEKNTNTKLLNIDKSETIEKYFWVWNYFTKPSFFNIVCCNLCKKEMSGNSSAHDLWKHLNQEHPKATNRNEVNSDNNSDNKVRTYSDDEKHSNDIQIDVVPVEKSDKCESATNNPDEAGTRKRSSVWKYFTKIPYSDLSCCNICEIKMTYKSGTTSNLWKHLARKHPQISIDTEGAVIKENLNNKDANEEYKPKVQKSDIHEVKPELVDATADEEKVPRNRRSSVWKYFTKLPESNIPRCNICQAHMSRKSGTSNLWRHIAGKHPQLQTDNDGSSSDDQFDEESQKQKSKASQIKPEVSDTTPEKDNKANKKRSSVWKYFTKLTPSNIPQCNICQAHMSCKSGTSNLWRHIAGKHPKIKTDKDESSSDEQSDDEEMHAEEIKVQKPNEEMETELLDNSDDDSRATRRRSFVWKYFTKLPNSNIPCCTICQARMSSKSGTSNLWRHIAGKHPHIQKGKDTTSSDEHSDNDTCSEKEKNSGKRRSSVWQHFTLSSDSNTASCNYCQMQMAYKSSTGNLWKHMTRKHPEKSSTSNEITSDESSDDEESQSDDNHVQVNNGRESRMWSFFTRIPSSDFASCNYCKKRISYKSSTGNLQKHISRKHSKKQTQNSEDDTTDEEILSDNAENFDSNKRSSPMWKLFKKVPNSDYVASCRLCRKEISYKTTTSNLQRHVGRRHPKYLDRKYKNCNSYRSHEPNNELSARNAQRFKRELSNFNKSGSSLWDLFKKIEASDSLASCKICHKELSYKTTTGNLKRHMYRKHRKLLPNEAQDQLQSLSEQDEDQKEEIPLLDIKLDQNNDNIPIQTVENIDDDDFWNMDTNTDDDDPDFRPSPTFEEELDMKNSSSGKKRSQIWNVFTEKPFSNFVAICNVCNQEFCYRSTTNNLKKHFQRKHPNLSMENKIERVVEESNNMEESNTKQENKTIFDDDDRDSSDEAASNSKRKRSQIWKYFTRKKPGEYVATCNLCKKELGFRSTTSNLKKHLDRKHPHIELKSENEDQKKSTPEVPVKTCLICLQTDQPEPRDFVQVNSSVPEEKNYMTKIQEIMNQTVVIDESHVMCQACVDDLEKVIQFKEKVSKAFEFWSKIETDPEPESYDNFADDIHHSDYSDLEDGESLAKFTCNKCNKVFPSPSVMLKHNCGQQPRKDKPIVKREVVDKDIKFYCEHCGRCFNVKWKLNKHLKKCQNNASKQFVCTLCDRVFKKAYHLREHMASHTGERNYSCNLCGKTFQRSSSKHKHMRSHNAKPGEKSKKTPFLCTICGKSFPYSNGASRHMRVHLGERRHECHICLKRFSQTTHLKVHLRTHSGERPYGCMICGRTFSLNASLRKHMRLHVGSGDFVKLVKNLETNMTPSEIVAADGLHVLTAVTQDIDMDANQCIA